MMIEQIIQRLNDLGPGESTVYHTGMLAFDREAKNGIKPPIDRVAKVAWDLYEKGRIRLTQRKLEYCNYEYIATGRTEEKIDDPRTILHPPRKSGQASPVGDS